LQAATGFHLLLAPALGRKLQGIILLARKASTLFYMYVPKAYALFYKTSFRCVILSLFTLLSVAAGLIYTTEHEVNPALPGYFTTLYFGLTTLTTGK
jgi:hypothetical protein